MIQLISRPFSDKLSGTMSLFVEEAHARAQQFAMEYDLCEVLPEHLFVAMIRGGNGSFLPLMHEAFTHTANARYQNLGVFLVQHVYPTLQCGTEQLPEGTQSTFGMKVLDIMTAADNFRKFRSGDADQTILTADVLFGLVTYDGKTSDEPTPTLKLLQSLFPDRNIYRNGRLGEQGRTPYFTSSVSTFYQTHGNEHGTR